MGSDTDGGGAGRGLPALGPRRFLEEMGKEAIPGRWCRRLTLQGEDGLRSAQLAPGMDVTNCSLFSKAKIRLGILEMGESGRTPS